MHDLTPLYEYINAQRRAGVSDNTTYHSLVSAGWAPEVASQAMNHHGQTATQPQQTTHTGTGQRQQQQPSQQPQTQQRNAEPATQQQSKGLFAGRLDRRGFLMGHLYILLLNIALLALLMMTGIAVEAPLIVSLLGLLVTLAVVPFSVALVFAIYAKRWHDVGQTGWFALFLMAAGIVLFVILLFVKSENKTNQYGPRPGKNLSPKAIFGY